MNFPDEILLKIMDNTSAASVVRMRRTCAELYNFISGVYWWSSFEFRLRRGSDLCLGEINVGRWAKCDIEKPLFIAKYRNDILYFTHDDIIKFTTYWIPINYYSMRKTLNRPLDIEANKEEALKCFHKINKLNNKIKEFDSIIDVQYSEYFVDLEYLNRVCLAEQDVEFYREKILKIRKKIKYKTQEMICLVKRINNDVIKQGVIESALDW